MLIIPAIDLKAGRCVRLVEGREQSAKVYDRDPVEVACGYKEEGARLIHVVDLDGAFPGTESENLLIIRRIVEQTALPVEAGGGVRSLADIERLLCDVGVRYVIAGTLAVEDPDLVASAVARFGDRIVAGIDARGSQVATRGWTETTEIDAFALARRMVEIGIERIIYTDISRDGTLSEPSYAATAALVRTDGPMIIASGGVGRLEHLRQLANIGVEAAIVGKALYTGDIRLAEAIEALK